jgi:hypothetical protein
LSKSTEIRIQKTTILPVVLYGCETWSLALREEYRLRVFGNRELMRIFGSRRDEILESWGKLQNYKYHNLYFLKGTIRSVKSRRIRWPGHVECMGEKKNAYRLLVQKPEATNPLRMPRCMRVDKIKMDLGEMGWAVWTGLIWIRKDLFRAFGRTVMNLSIP